MEGSKKKKKIAETERDRERRFEIIETVVGDTYQATSHKTVFIVMEVSLVVVGRVVCVVVRTVDSTK